MRSPRPVTEAPYIPQNPPPGLAALYMLCKRIYPDQCNPLQATTLVKYWYAIIFSVNEYIFGSWFYSSKNLLFHFIENIDYKHS